MDRDFSELLARLPKGSNVGVITMQGSCCPVTRAHIQCFAESRKILMKKYGFGEAVGLLSLNGDTHIGGKLAEKGLPLIPLHDRAMLIGLASRELPWMTFSSVKERDFKLGDLASRWPDLKFVQYRVNGADDVVKNSKWRSASASKRYIAMGRPGLTEELTNAVKKAVVDPSWFVIGPELPDISSTAVRNACMASDLKTLDEMLHPDVAEWCLTKSPYRPSDTAVTPATISAEDDGRRRGGCGGGGCGGEAEAKRKTDEEAAKQSWKATSGRETGGDGYKFGDVSRTVARTLVRAVRRKRDA